MRNSITLPKTPTLFYSINAKEKQNRNFSSMSYQQNSETERTMTIQHESARNQDYGTATEMKDFEISLVQPKISNVRVFSK